MSNCSIKDNYVDVRVCSDSETKQSIRRRLSRIHFILERLKFTQSESQTLKHAIEKLCISFLPMTICKSDSYFVVTQKKVHSFEYKWIIDKFPNTVDCLDNLFWLLSQAFSPSNETRYVFNLCLCPNISQNYLSLKLYFTSNEFKKITARFRVSILDTKENKWTRWDEKITISKCGKFIIPKFFHYSYLNTPPIIEEYLPNDRLTLLCEVWVEDDKIEELKTEYNLLRPATIPSIQMNNVSVNGSHFLMNSTSQIGGNAEIKNSLINENSVDKN